MVGARGRAISPTQRSVRASRSVQKDRASREDCALRAALLSALVPGAGQIYLGRRRRGLAMVAISALALGVGGGLWLLDPILVLSWLVQPRVLLGLLALNALLLAFRLFAVVDAYRLARADWQAIRDIGRRGRRIGVSAALALLLILTAAPHVAAGYYAYLTYELLTEVFPSNDTTENARPPRVRRAPRQAAPAPAVTPSAP